MIESNSPLKLSLQSLGLIIISRKADGNMKPGFDTETPSNRRNFFQFYVGEEFPDVRTVMADVSHEGRAKVVDSWSDSMQPGVDALITNDPKVMLCITLADCHPVFFLDEENKVLGLAHCSYKTISDNILYNVIEEMIGLGARRDRIHILFGPGIKICCYEFGIDCARNLFGDFPQAIVPTSNGKCQLDLERIIRLILNQDEEIPYYQISANGSNCTCCGYEETLFSARRDKLQPVQAGIAGIMIKS